MSVRTSVVYRGDLHCEATHEASKSTITTDAPVDNQGKGEAFSPTDLVGAAMGTCMATIMGIAADRLGVSIEGTTVTVDKEMIADPHRRIAKLTTVIRVPGHHDARTRRTLERAAMTCPVHRSLDERVDKPVTFEWED
jgi:putative redox protein